MGPLTSLLHRSPTWTRIQADFLLANGGRSEGAEVDGVERSPGQVQQMGKYRRGERIKSFKRRGKTRRMRRVFLDSFCPKRHRMRASEHRGESNSHARRASGSQEGMGDKHDSPTGGFTSLTWEFRPYIWVRVMSATRPTGRRTRELDQAEEGY